MEETDGCELGHAGRFPAAFDTEEHALNASGKLAGESEVKKNGAS